MLQQHSHLVHHFTFVYCANKRVWDLVEALELAGFKDPLKTLDSVNEERCVAFSEQLTKRLDHLLLHNTSTYTIPLLVPIVGQNILNCPSSVASNCRM